MRFGHFFYPMNFAPSRDYQSIEACLDEADLVERLGFDAIWIAEHHFIGEAVYGDALLFGAAIAVKAWTTEALDYQGKYWQVPSRSHPRRSPLQTTDRRPVAMPMKRLWARRGASRPRLHSCKMPALAISC